MTNIYYPSHSSKYPIPKDKPILLKTACTAGVNRSATVRQFIKNQIHLDSIVLPQYGAFYGDFDANPITNFETNEPDGFTELFGTNKSPSMQSILFKRIGYDSVPDFIPQELDMHNEKHVTLYKESLLVDFWNVETTYPSIFILINESEEVIECVIKRLTDSPYPCDLVILKEKDIIYEPTEVGVVAQSRRAYELFVEKIAPYFEFV